MKPHNVYNVLLPLFSISVTLVSFTGPVAWTFTITPSNTRGIEHPGCVHGLSGIFLVGSVIWKRASTCVWAYSWIKSVYSDYEGRSEAVRCGHRQGGWSSWGRGGDEQQRLPQGWGHPTWWVMQAQCVYGPLGSDARSGASDVPLWRWALTCVVIVEREWDHACQKHLAQCLARIEHTTNVKYHCCYYSCQCNTWLLKGGISWYRRCAGKITSSVARRMAESRSMLIHESRRTSLCVRHCLVRMLRLIPAPQGQPWARPLSPWSSAPTAMCSSTVSPTRLFMYENGLPWSRLHLDL